MHPVNASDSRYEFQSAGRLYLNFTKTEAPAKWARLLKTEEKLQNMRLWWELHDKFINDLEDFDEMQRLGKKGERKESKKQEESGGILSSLYNYLPSFGIF